MTTRSGKTVTGTPSTNALDTLLTQLTFSTSSKLLLLDVMPTSSASTPEASRKMPLSSFFHVEDSLFRKHLCQRIFRKYINLYGPHYTFYFANFLASCQWWNSSSLLQYFNRSHSLTNDIESVYHSIVLYSNRTSLISKPSMSTFEYTGEALFLKVQYVALLVGAAGIGLGLL